MSKSKRVPKQALKIVVYGLSDWPELAELEEAGHEVYRLDTEADLILGPKCWRMDEPLRKYLKDAILAARRAQA